MCSSSPSLSSSLLTGLRDIEYVSVVLFCYILYKKNMLITKKTLSG